MAWPRRPYGDFRAANMILFGELEHGSRSVGRPKLRYKDNCKQLLKRIYLLDWNVVAKDRPLWRSKIRAVCESLNVLRMERYRRRKEEKDRIYSKTVYCCSHCNILSTTS